MLDVVSGKAVELEVSPVGFAGAAQTASCTTGSTGQCRVSLAVPEGWFESGAGASDRTVSLAYGLQGSGTQRDAGTATLRAFASAEVLLDAVATMPFRDLYRDGGFEVPVEANAEFYINTWQLLVETTSGEVTISSISFDSGTWSATVNIDGTGTSASINAAPADPLARPTGPSSEAELLCTVQLQVAGGAQVGEASMVSVTDDVMVKNCSS